MNLLFKQDGLFLIQDFLTRDYAEELRREVTLAPQYHTPLEDIERRIELKNPPKGRPKTAFDISPDNQNKLETKISGIKQEVEDYFSVKLERMKIPYYAVYRENDFLEFHADAPMNDLIKSHADWTQIAIVVFLNDEEEIGVPNCYVGGKLNVYGVVVNPAVEKFGYPIKGETGKLVAFRSTCFHEVTPVISGTRYIVNSGFY